MSEDQPPRTTASRGHWAAVDAGRRQRVRTSSTALRAYAPERALVDVTCRRSVILRVLDGVPLNAALEAQHVAVVLVDLTAAPVVAVDCHRCGETHEIGARVLVTLARDATPGHAVAVSVNRVKL